MRALFTVLFAVLSFSLCFCECNPGVCRLLALISAPGRFSPGFFDSARYGYPVYRHLFRCASRQNLPAARAAFRPRSIIQSAV